MKDTTTVDWKDEGGALLGQEKGNAIPSELPQQLHDTYEANLEEKLRALFPHGHPDFIRMCIDEMHLHSEKNHDYASKERPLQNFSDVAAIFALFPGLELSDPTVVALVFMVKQLVAVLHLKADHIVAQVEGMEPRMRDVSVYSKLIPILERAKQ